MYSIKPSHLRPDFLLPVVVKQKKSGKHHVLLQRIYICFLQRFTFMTATHVSVSVSVRSGALKPDQIYLCFHDLRFEGSKYIHEKLKLLMRQKKKKKRFTSKSFIGCWFSL